MAAYDIGFLIKHLRQERGITQKQLCAGLCPISTLSRIERGLLVPSSYFFRAIMERLGAYAERFHYAFLDKNDFVIWQKRDMLRNALFHKDIFLAESLLSELEGTDFAQNKLGKQFILNCRAILELDKAEVIDGYEVSFEDCRQKLYESLNMTIPEFSEDKIGSYMLSHDEFSAINALAGIYSLQGKYEQAAHVLYALKLNIDELIPDSQAKVRLYPSVLCNLAETLLLLKRYEEAAALCVLGQRFCIQYGRAAHVPMFMHIQARCFTFQDKKDIAKSLVRDAYYTARALGQEKLEKLLGEYFIELCGQPVENCILNE